MSIILNSFHINQAENTAAIPSATGAEYITPSIPMKIGRIINKGSRKIICLVRERNTPFPDFPMDVKVFAVIGCIPLIKVKNK